MRKVIANLFVSADGFAADRAEEMGWVTDEFGPETGKFVHDGHYAMDAMLLGRVTYEIMAPYWPTASPEDEPLAEFMNEIPKIVFSTTLEEPLSWQNATLAEDGLGEAVSKLKQEPGREIGIVGSVKLGHELARLGLLDGYRLVVHPVVLGSAGYKPVFEGLGETRLRLIDSTVLDSRCVALDYEIEPADGEQ